MLKSVLFIVPKFEDTLYVRGIKNMTVARQMDIRSNIKMYFDMAYEGEAVFVPRKENKNVYVISQAEYESLQKARRNAEYYEMLDKSRAQLSSGEKVSITLDDLRAME